MFRRAGTVLAVGLAATAGPAMPAWAQGTTERVSVGPGGAQGNGFSDDPALSADGRFVAFESDASNLVPGDTNDAVDVFVRDRQTGTTRRVSSGRAASRAMATATTRRSRRTGASSPSRRAPPTWCRATPTARPTSSSATARRARPERVSVGPGGVQGNDQQLRPGALGGRALRRLRLDRHQPGAGRHQRRGRRVRPRPPDGHDPAGERRAGRRPGQWRQLRARRSRPTGASSPSTSDATNLVPGDTNGTDDVFVRDRRTGTTERVSVGPGGVQGDGTELPQPGDLGGRALRRLRVGRHQPGAGRHQRRWCDVFVRDRQTGTTRRVSVGPGGAQGNERQLRTRRSRRTALRRLLLGGHQPGAGRHQRRGRRVRPRPPDAARPGG